MDASFTTIALSQSPQIERSPLHISLRRSILYVAALAESAGLDGTALPITTVLKKSFATCLVIIRYFVIDMGLYISINLID